MKAYLSIFRIRMQETLQYRAAAWAGIATQFFWGWMLIMIYQGFYESSDRVMPMTFPQMCSYIWVQQAFLMCTVASVGRDGELFQKITSGNLAYELCRPLELYQHWSARLIASRLGSAALRCVPLLTITLFLPYPYKLILPSSFAQVVLFIVSLLVGTMLTVSVSMFVYILTFKTLNANGVMTVIGAISEVFSGFLVAIPFMPQGFQKLAMMLPFRYMADLPFRIFNGDIPIQDGLWQLGVAVVWLLALWVIGSWGMKRILRSAIIQGG